MAIAGERKLSIKAVICVKRSLRQVRTTTYQRRRCEGHRYYPISRTARLSSTALLGILTYFQKRQRCERQLGSQRQLILLAKYATPLLWTDENHLEEDWSSRSLSRCTYVKNRQKKRIVIYILQQLILIEIWHEYTM